MARILDGIEFYHERCFYDHKDEATLSVADIVDEWQNVKNKPASQVAHFYAHVRRLSEEMDAHLSELNALKNHIATVALPLAFELEDVSTVTLGDGSRVTVQQTVRASIKPDKKDDAIAWLEQNGMDEVPQVTVNASTLASVARTVLKSEEGVEAGLEEDGNVRRIYDLPEHLFNIDLAPQVSVTKGKKK